jgi:hypothetical protein
VDASIPFPANAYLLSDRAPGISGCIHVFGLKLGAEPDEVLAMAEKDQAPFVQFSEYKDWVRSSIEALRKL